MIPKSMKKKKLPKRVEVPLVYNATNLSITLYALFWNGNEENMRIAANKRPEKDQDIAASVESMVREFIPLGGMEKAVQEFGEDAIIRYCVYDKNLDLALVVKYDLGKGGKK